MLTYVANSHLNSIRRKQVSNPFRPLHTTDSASLEKLIEPHLDELLRILQTIEIEMVDRFGALVDVEIDKCRTADIFWRATCSSRYQALDKRRFTRAKIAEKTDNGIGCQFLTQCFAKLSRFCSFRRDYSIHRST